MKSGFINLLIFDALSVYDPISTPSNPKVDCPEVPVVLLSLLLLISRSCEKPNNTFGSRCFRERKEHSSQRFTVPITDQTLLQKP